MQKDWSQGIYVHFPFCRSRCAYCGFVSSTGAYAQREYADALCREIYERVRGNADTVFIGGGTPSVAERGVLTRIFAALRESATLSPSCEIASEANPDSCTHEFLEEVALCGVNRISLGVQTLNDSVLANAGRRHTAAQALEAIGRVQMHGIRNINCDLMLGLPEQTERDIAYAVDELCARGITHMSVYALGVEEGTPLYGSGYRPNEDLCADMYDFAYERLRANGFVRYEVSNFCREGYVCRHNYKYWTLAPYIGVGAAAHSFDGVCRSCNTSDIAAYIGGDRKEYAQTIASAERLEEYIMLGLRTRDGITFARASELAGCDWQKSKEEELQRLTDLRCLQRTEAGVRLAEKAFYTMNEIIVRLL